MHGKRFPPRQPPDAGRISDRGGRNIKRREHFLETCFVIDGIEHLRQRHEASAVDFVGDERIEVVAPLFPVDHDIDARIKLNLHAAPHLFVGDGIKLRARNLVLLLCTQGFEELP